MGAHRPEVNFGWCFSGADHLTFNGIVSLTGSD